MSTRREQRKRKAQAEVPDIIEQKQRKYDEAQWDRSPLKQYVRRYGWLQIIEDYIERRRNDGVELPLKFLTLPGANASDIGLWWKAGVLKKREDGTLNVAICDKEYADVVTIYLRDLGGVLDYSNKPLHEALKAQQGALRKHFPFDVINVDICGSLISRRRKSEMEAVERLFRLQRGQCFLLLLTTRPDVTAMDRLITILQGNFTEGPFREAYHMRYDDMKPEELYERSHIVFNQLVIPKVVARLGREFGYKTYEHFVANYFRGEHDYRMICHSFEFEPIGRRNPTNKYRPRFKHITEDNIDHILNDELSNTVRSSALSAYTDFTVSVVKRDPVDVSAILKDDPELYAELEAEAESLIQWWENVN